MTPSQIIADNAKTLARAQHPTPQTISCEMRSERENHHIVSECQKPKSVLFATKRELREVQKDTTNLHYVLICKGEVLPTNTSQQIPPSLMSILQEFEDVFPQELPSGLPPLRGIEHRIDLIPGAPLPNRAAYRTNPEETKEIERQIRDLLDKGYGRESLSPCADRKSVV